MKKYHVAKGDKVVVIAGTWKGEEAQIRAILPKKDRVVLEFTAFDAKKREAEGKRSEIGKRTVSKNRRRGQENNPGMIERSVSVHVSNVALTEEGRKAKEEKLSAWRAKKASARTQE